MDPIMYVYILLVILSIVLFIWNNARIKQTRSYNVSQCINEDNNSAYVSEEKTTSSIPTTSYFNNNEGQEGLADLEADKKTVFFNNARDLLYRFQVIPNPKWEYLSHSVYEITGYTQEEHYKDPSLVFNTVHHDDMHFLIEKLSNKIDYSKPIVQKWYRKDGSLIWLEEYCSPVYDSKGMLIAVEGICRDITERIQRENSNKGLNPIDHLTRMYNRRYFEHKLKSMEKHSKIGVIVVGIDNLRTINYEHGYEQGTVLILKLSEILKNIYIKDATIARIGDSEFAIVLENTNVNTLESISRELLKSALDFNNSTPRAHLHISIGYSCSEDGSLSSIDTYMQADKNMYNNKLNRKYEIKSST